MLLETAIVNAQRDIPGCFALGLVDLSTGAVLCGSAFEPGDFELAAAACGELLQPNADEADAGIRRTARKGGANDSGFERQAFGEALIVGRDRVHVFLRSRSQASCAYVAVCACSAGLGLVLAKVRASLGAIDAAA
jgi:hypothetical protein